MEAETDTPKPAVLYHYTDAAGLTGILDPSWPADLVPPEGGGSALLRASDVRYMNDSGELRFGADLLADGLRRDAAAHPDVMGEVFVVLADRLSQGLFAPDARHLRAFAACFCADGDLLSQWRGYAGGVGGYAIGFPTEILEFRAWAILPRPSQMALTTRAPALPVRYGHEQAVVAIDQFIGQLRAGWGPESTSKWVISDETGRPHIEWMMGSSYRLIAQLKHEAFKEEREYRLIYAGGDGHLISTRARAAGLVPFVNFAVNLPEDGKRPDETLAEVVVGPGADQYGQVAAVRDFLQAKGYGRVPVRTSEAPYRG